MFGWCFLQSMDISCSSVPLLVPYIHGVAITCICSFVVGLIPFLSSEDSHYNSSEFDSWGEPRQRCNHQDQELVGLDKENKLPSLNIFLMLLHLFWFMFGSVNILPMFVLDDSVSRWHGCDEVHFCFCFLCLCLQWFFLPLVLVWYKVESTVQEKPGFSQDSKEALLERRESFQYYSFPNPIFA